MQRLLEPELLDSLPPDDPRAIHSRRDLRIINSWMRNPRHLLAAIRSLNPPPGTILELGAGDGTLMLKLARLLARERKYPVRLWLLDFEPVISKETLDAFHELGWTAEVIRMDLKQWIRDPHPDSFDLVTANLFLHHFQDAELRELFSCLASRARAVITCDPRRWLPSLISAKFLWLLGCNQVTRFDAAVSIRAGFREKELSALWPADSGHQLSEIPAGYASHLFVAARSC